MLSGASKTCGAVALVCVGLHAGAEGLHGVPLNDAELADTWGQALLNLTNTSVNDLDFTRITLAADIRINANLGNIRLGEYSYSANNGTGADIDISQLNFGGAGSVASKSTVLITDPYMEFVYRNAGNAATREVVGMRLGFGGIAGNVGVQFNSVSGSLLMTLADGRTIDITGKRVDAAAACSSGTTCTTLSQVSGVTAGDSNGASRDFYISVLKSGVTFPGTATVPASTAQSGFWMNWRDRVAATSTR